MLGQDPGFAVIDPRDESEGEAMREAIRNRPLGHWLPCGTPSESGHDRLLGFPVIWRASC
jgi:hypothetical protein